MIRATRKEVFLTFISDMPATERFMTREGRVALATEWFAQWQRQQAEFLADEPLPLADVTSVWIAPTEDRGRLMATFAFLFEEGRAPLDEAGLRRQFWSLMSDDLDRFGRAA